MEKFIQVFDMKMKNSAVLKFEEISDVCYTGGKAHTDWITDLHWEKKRRKGRIFYSSSWDGTIKKWDLRNITRPVTSCKLEGEKFNTFALFPRGNLI